MGRRGMTMKFGTPLAEQAKAEVSEANGHVDEAIAAIEKGVAWTTGTLEIRKVLETARVQLQQATNSLAYIRDIVTGNDYYRKEAELGVHRVREAITNL